MTDDSLSKFSAANSALGYLYQVRYALLAALRRQSQGREFMVSFEILDDVAFEPVGADPMEIVQTKHHRTRTATLTDACSDLWRTIRIWAVSVTQGQLPGDTLYNLATTAVAGTGSAAALLRAGDRDVELARQKLDATAQTSANKENAPGYAAFRALTMDQQRSFLECVTILDAQPAIADLDEELKQAVFWAAERSYHEAFLGRLEGWWCRRVIRHLLKSADGDRILGTELEGEMSELREQFKREALPVDDDLITFNLDETTRAAHATSTFVLQLELIAAERARVTAAIRDYYRAFQQRSRWVRDDLLLVGEVDKYERILIEEWELCFSNLKNELGAEAAEEAKQRAARAVLRWAETVTIPIRPNVTQPFVTRGSLHMLADGARLGWHPDFRDRLAALLAERKAS
jgi:hypothetical protein